MTILLSILLAVANPAAGTWSMAPLQDGRVQFAVRFQSPDGRTSNEHDNGVALSDIGLTAGQVDGPSHHVAFTQTRDAGTFAFDGSVAQRSGGGSVTFTPSQAYIAAMHQRGYDLDSDQLLTAATLDISLAYVDSLAAVGFPHLAFGDIVSFRALKIDDAYVRAMKAAFHAATIEPHDVVSLRALDVTPAYLEEMRAAGHPAGSPRDAVEFRAMKIDSDFVRELAAVGYPDLTSHQLVEFKALHIDADYIKRVQAHGFPHPTVDQLVRLKAMNVI